jgi:hypothetical protein
MFNEEENEFARRPQRIKLHRELHEEFCRRQRQHHPLFLKVPEQINYKTKPYYSNSKQIADFNDDYSNITK